MHHDTAGELAPLNRKAPGDPGYHRQENTPRVPECEGPSQEQSERERSVRPLKYELYLHGIQQTEDCADTNDKGDL